MRYKRTVLVVLVVTVVTVAGAVTASAQMEGGTEEGEMSDGMDAETNDTATTFTVTVENVASSDVYPSNSSTGGAVWVTPGAYAVHTEGNPILTEGETASAGLEALAEAGLVTGFDGESGLVDELDRSMGVAASGSFTPENTVEDPNDPMGEVPGAPPIAPGGAFEFQVEATQGQHLSLATMYVPSNDIFLATSGEGIGLWENGEPVSGDVTDELTLWDSGTETNQQPGFGSDQAPAQSEPDQGDDEGGVVRPLSTVNDGYRYPSVDDTVRVTVTPEEGAGSEGDGMSGNGMNDDGMGTEGMDNGDMGEEGMSDTDSGMEEEGMNNTGSEGMDGESEPTDDGQSLPGFGVVAGVLALLFGGGYAVARGE